MIIAEPVTGRPSRARSALRGTRTTPQPREDGATGPGRLAAWSLVVLTFALPAPTGHSCQQPFGNLNNVRAGAVASEHTRNLGDISPRCLGELSPRNTDYLESTGKTSRDAAELQLPTLGIYSPLLFGKLALANPGLIALRKHRESQLVQFGALTEQCFPNRWHRAERRRSGSHGDRLSCRLGQESLGDLHDHCGPAPPFCGLAGQDARHQHSGAANGRGDLRMGDPGHP